MAVLGARTLRALAMALGLDRDFFYGCHPMLQEGRGRQTYLRSNYYPAFKGEAISDTMIRFGEHADYGTLTLLLQDSLPGLQVKHPARGWVEAPPMEGAIVVSDSVSCLVETNWRCELTTIPDERGSSVGDLDWWSPSSLYS